jgi:N-ethylmaleimide reductase
MPPHANALNKKIPYLPPRELEDDEVPEIIELFVKAAKNVMAAGFDGVEIHGANGFLIDEFWRQSTNQRPWGRYSGACVQSRSQFALDVVQAVAAVVGADRVGMRIGPLNSWHEMNDPEREPLTRYLCQELSKIGIAYVHLIRGDFFGVLDGDALPWVRESFKGFVISNMAYKPPEAEATVAGGQADAISFGFLFLANADLPVRVAKEAELNVPNLAGVYGRGNTSEAGYTDYPLLETSLTLRGSGAA